MLHNYGCCSKPLYCACPFSCSLLWQKDRWSRLLCEAYHIYHAGEVDSALMMHLLLGEMIGQSNATYILEECFLFRLFGLYTTELWWYLFYSAS